MGKSTLVSALKDTYAVEWCGFLSTFRPGSPGIRVLEAHCLPSRHTFRLAQQLEPRRRLVPDFDGMAALARELEHMGHIWEADRGFFFDEVGFLETLHAGLQDAIWNALNRFEVVLGTVRQMGTPFLRRIQDRNDLQLFALTRENRDSVFQQCHQWMQNGGKEMGRCKKSY